jgi:hypothetical protein
MHDLNSSISKDDRWQSAGHQAARPGNRAASGKATSVATNDATAVVIPPIAVLISAMLCDRRSLHLREDVDHRCPVIPGVLEDVGIAKPPIDLPRVVRQMVDLDRNIPRGLAIPVHPAMKSRRLPGEMRDVAKEAILSASSVVRAVDRLTCGVLRPLVKNVRELAHSLVGPFIEPLLLPIVVCACNRGDGESSE